MDLFNVNVTHLINTIQRKYDSISAILFFNCAPLFVFHSSDDLTTLEKYTISTLHLKLSDFSRLHPVQIKLISSENARFCARSFVHSHMIATAFSIWYTYYVKKFRFMSHIHSFISPFISASVFSGCVG